MGRARSGKSEPTEAGLKEAFEKLQRQYDDLVSRNLAGVYRTTLDGQILECNDSLARILGYDDREHLMAQKAFSLYPSKVDREAFLNALKVQNKLINFEITLKHRTGRPVIVLENVFLDEPSDGLATIQGTLIDITAKRQFELEQASVTASYRSLVEHMRDGVLVVKDRMVQFGNPAAAHFLGPTRFGQLVEEVFDVEDRPAVIHLIDQAASGVSCGPVTARLKDPAGREMMLFAAQVLHEGEPAVQLTIQDEHERRSLLQERLRVQIAEEVNAVLRKEIEEHHSTQEALRRSRRFARSLIDSSLDMILAADPTGLITEYNPAASMRFGYEAEEVIGKRTVKLYADPVEFTRIQKELDQYGSFSGEISNITKDGEVFTSYLAASRMYDEDGQFLGAMGVSRDITRMKQDQLELKESEERYRDLFESATDLIQSVDPDGRFQYVNNAWKKTLGYSDEEVKKLRFFDVVHPEHLESCKERFDQVMAGENAVRIRTVFRDKQGRSVQVEGTTNPREKDGLTVAARSIFTNVSHVHEAREKVEHHEAKLRALFESSEHMFWTVDPGIKITSFNSGYRNMIERLHGQAPEINNDPDRPRKMFASPEYHTFWGEKYAQALAGKAVRFETDLIDQQGERVCNEIFLSPVFGANGKVTEVFGVGHEITEQIVAEELVRHQAARLKAIFENAANVMIWTLDRDFKITSFNDHFQRTARSKMGIEFAHGDPFIEIMRDHLANGPNDPVVAKYRAGIKGDPQQFEVEVIGRDGRHIWVETFLNPISHEDQVRELSCMAYGITDRKEAEHELRQSLSEKEVLLKEVHHRVKNNLQVISSILSLQTAHVDGDERILELLRVSRDRIRSMSFIHESLYQNKDFSSIDMSNYIDGLSRNLVMSYSLNGKVSLERDLERVDLILDQAIPCGLILNELISNAIKHAFPKGQEGVVRIGLKQVNDQVTISVADDGVGLREGFNAKLDGNLGLELVNTLVEQLDGTLKVSTGKGVTYLLTFGRIK